MTVTDTRQAGRNADSRNAVLMAEIDAELQASRDADRRMSPETRERLNAIAGALNGGPVTEGEREARHRENLHRQMSFCCEQCERAFDSGDVIYRKRSPSGDDGPWVTGGWMLESYCDDCVSKWHPSWRKARRDPSPCRGGCGALVSFWNWENITTCSERCSRLVQLERKRVHHDQRLCDVCLELFTPKRSDARYCSSACRQDAYRKRKAGFA